MLSGDNGCGGDVWLVRNGCYPNMIAEESVSIRAVKRVYERFAGLEGSDLTPKDIFEIADGKMGGNKNAAVKSFQEFGKVAGMTIAGALNIVDGIVVLGGGITGAAKYFMPSLLEELRGNLFSFPEIVFLFCKWIFLIFRTSENSILFYRMKMNL